MQGFNAYNDHAVEGRFDILNSKRYLHSLIKVNR